MAVEDEVEFPQPLNCILTADPRSVESGQWGFITFIDPKHGSRTTIPVTTEASWHSDLMGPIWHIEIDDELDTATTSPSIHATDDWHSPNPALWNIVELLGDE